MPKPKSARMGKSSNNDGAIIVSSQQSRFHADANDAPTSKDIDIHDLTISIGGLEILDHAHLKIQDGLHYIFHGRNGTGMTAYSVLTMNRVLVRGNNIPLGKSTVLKALAERRIPGVAPNLRLLLVGQTRLVSATSSEPVDESAPTLTVLNYVTTSDRKREEALRRLSRLSSVLEVETGHSAETATVIRQIKLEQAETEMGDAELVAARRSGARGLRARQDLIEKETLVEQARSRLEQDATENAESDLRSGIDMLEAVRADLEAMDAGQAESRARMALHGLGFSEKQIYQPVTELSGGWRSRCELACALTQQTDVLMLDEPTNFLDLPAIMWLQRHIATKMSAKTVLLVTHDRDFADAVADELLLLRLNPARTLETFKGNLTQYEAEKRRQIRRMTKMSEVQEKKNKHMEETIERNLKAARRTGDDKKLKQAASRRKKIDERTGVEVGMSGGRFKLNRDLSGWHNTARAAIDIPGFDPPVSLSFPEQPAPLRHSGSLVSFDKVSFSYPRTGTWTLKDIDLVIHPGDRVGLVGMNGTGKTTIIQLLMGVVTGEGLRATKGTITTHPKARCGYFSQHAVEELEQLGHREPKRTALSQMAEVAGSSFSEQDVRGSLAGLGLRGNVVSDVPLASLSGGQRVRLALAETLFGSPHLLVLDEVTTHLDADTIGTLIDELRSWQGALLIVTHDRYFMRRVVEREADERTDSSDDEGDADEDEKAPGRVYRLFKAGLHKLDGGMLQYEDLVMTTVTRREAI